ncbi:MAG: tRNA epoxyqueuosine(34) reductase QueG [Bacteroidales bacterium]|nr:tRNA epoxyqueuosine(34) reductase QueG [Bacteroidales bacterium]
MSYIPLHIVKELAEKEGFCNCGAAKCEKLDLTSFKQWLERGYHASMSYLERNFDKRENPGLLFEDTKTIFCFLMSYNDDDNSEYHEYKIASYALRRDYHHVMKQKLNNIIIQLQAKFPDLQARPFVDSAPVKEREWAIKCGLGWKGKNSLLVTKNFGNKVFIGEILCNCESDYATEAGSMCGNCNKCLTSCPNNAILPDGSINANLCISYQTIENKENIPDNIRLHNYIYGCDICLNACIWNNKAMKTEMQDSDVKNIAFHMLDKIENDEDFEEEFRKLRKMTPMDRIKYSKLVSNVNLAKRQNDM